MTTITCKIVMCGDFAVGKTTFVQFFLGGTVLSGYKATVGVDIGKKDLKINDHNLVLQIWDLSGQHTFDAIRNQFYSRSDGVVLVYDISRRETFENIPTWLNEVLEITGPIPCVLVANKIDLGESIESSVRTNEGIELAKKLLERTGIQVPFIEASALKLENNLEPFQQIGKKILERRKIQY
jgi:small GTP-binding protein